MKLTALVSLLQVSLVLLVQLDKEDFLDRQASKVNQDFLVQQVQQAKEDAMEILALAFQVKLVLLVCKDFQVQQDSEGLLVDQVQVAFLVVVDSLVSRTHLASNFFFKIARHEALV